MSNNNNTKLKVFMASNGFKVCEYTEEVRWITNVSVTASGSTVCLTRYLGGLDEDCYTPLQHELKVLNLPNKKEEK